MNATDDRGTLFMLVFGGDLIGIPPGWEYAEYSTRKNSWPVGFITPLLAFTSVIRKPQYWLTRRP